MLFVIYLFIFYCYLCSVSHTVLSRSHIWYMEGNQSAVGLGSVSLEVRTWRSEHIITNRRMEIGSQLAFVQALMTNVTHPDALSWFSTSPLSPRPFFYLAQVCVVLRRLADRLKSQGRHLITTNTRVKGAVLRLFAVNASLCPAAEYSSGTCLNASFSAFSLSRVGQGLFFCVSGCF